jgi:hypothetical protein
MGSQQLARNAAVFAYDDIGIRQQVEGAQRDVPQIADRRGHQVKARVEPLAFTSLGRLARLCARIARSRGRRT